MCGFDDQKYEVAEDINTKRRSFRPQTLHAKYVDDMTILESFNMRKVLTPSTMDRPQPDPYRKRTGHTLQPQCSRVYEQIEKIQTYADNNDMKINYDKTKFMVFHPCTIRDFLPEFSMENHEIELVEKIKLLGKSKVG